MSNMAFKSCSICGGTLFVSVDEEPPEFLFCEPCTDPKSMRNVITAGAIKVERREQQSR